MKILVIIELILIIIDIYIVIDILIDVIKLIIIKRKVRKARKIIGIEKYTEMFRAYENIENALLTGDISNIKELKIIYK